jgi:hypothetical protein
MLTGGNKKKGQGGDPDLILLVLVYGQVRP